MSDSPTASWPSEVQDRALIAALQRYRHAFEVGGDGVRRPLITRINPDDPRANMLYISLPAGDHGKTLLDQIEFIVVRVIRLECDPGETELVERTYDV